MASDDTIKSGKELAAVATDLLDSDVEKAVQIIVQLQNKYKHRANTAANLEKLRDEALTRLADIGLLATLDPAPCFYDEPPVLEIIGKVADPGFHKAFDHEQKKAQVLAANKRGEDYYGQREPINPTSKAAKRGRSARKDV